jgi:hypothetical protein
MPLIFEQFGQRRPEAAGWAGLSRRGGLTRPELKVMARAGVGAVLGFLLIALLTGCGRTSDGGGGAAAPTAVPTPVPARTAGGERVIAFNRAYARVLSDPNADIGEVLAYVVPGSPEDQKVRRTIAAARAGGARWEVSLTSIRIDQVVIEDLLDVRVATTETWSIRRLSPPAAGTPFADRPACTAQYLYTVVLYGGDWRIDASDQQGAVGC